MKTDNKVCKVQFRKPITITGKVIYLEEVGKFEVTTRRGVSLLDPQDVIMIEELPFERHESEVNE